MLHALGGAHAEAAIEPAIVEEEDAARGVAFDFDLDFTAIGLVTADEGERRTIRRAVALALHDHGAAVVADAGALVGAGIVESPLHAQAVAAEIIGERRA